MKIIQINASYKPAFIYGGPTMSVSKLAEVLASKEVNVEVLTTSANGVHDLDVRLGAPLLIDNVNVTYYKRLTKDHTHFSPALYNALRKKLSTADDRTIVHIHTWWNLVSVFSCLIAHQKKVKVVLSPRGTLSAYSFKNRNNFIKNIIYKISKPLLERCHFHVTSKNEEDSILSLLKPKSITIIPNLVDLPSYPVDREELVQNDIFKLLFLSRIEQKKGLELLFKSLENIPYKYSLTIGGSGDSEYINQLKELSESLHIDDKIVWVGQKSSDEKFTIMSQHNILVLPSYDENFANVVIESLASGTAVLVTENVGLSNYITENDLGWVCKFDKDSLRNTIIEAELDKNKLRKIREEAPFKIREDFSDQRISQYYISMYLRILTNV